MPNVVMPNGMVIRDVPDGTTKAQLLEKLEANGYNVAELIVPPQEENMLEKVPVVGDAAAWLADSPLGIASGATTGVKMLTDLFGAGNAASEALGDMSAGLNDMRSSEARRDALINQIDAKRAEGQGTWEEVKAAGRGFLRSPLDTTANAAGTAAPAILAGVLTGGVAPVAAMVGVGAAQGVGERKGGIYDATVDAFLEAGVPEEQARAAADEAQSYGGENLDQLALAAVLGGIAARFGFELPAARLLGSSIAGRVAGGKVASGITKGAVVEAIPEGVQGAQSKLSDNLALQRQGFDADTFAGVAGQGVSEALAGAMLGGAFGARGNKSEDVTTPTAPQAAGTPMAPSMRETAEKMFTTPEQMAEFDALVTQFTTMYGFPEDQAAQLAMGALRPAGPSENPVPAGGEVSSATEPTVAPAPTPTVEPAPIIPPIEAVSPQASINEQLAPTPPTAAPAAPAPPPAAPVAPAPEPALSGDFGADLVAYNTMVGQGQVPPSPLVSALANKVLDLSISGELSTIAADPQLGPAVQQFYSNEAAAVNAVAAARASQPAAEPITPVAVVEPEAAPEVEPAAPTTLSLPDAKRKVTPDRIAAAREMLALALATPEFQGVEITRKEITAAANKMARTPGLEAPAVLTEILGIDAMEAAEATPAATPEPVLEAPSEAPAPLDAALPEQDTPVPVTKVAPGDARGSRPVQRGTQGTQRGRPVEGAAQLTQGMQAQQALASELEAARKAREISDKDVAETLDILRAPSTEQELRAMPIERRNQWVEAIALQRQVDELQQRVNEVPKEVLGQPNPERADMEASLGKLQQKLDSAQQVIVGEARKAFNSKRTGRKMSVGVMRKRLRDKNLSPAERRDLEIALREATVQRAQKGKTAKADTRTPEQVDTELSGKSTAQVLDWMVDTAPNEALAAIARAVRNAINRQQRLGWAVDFKIVRLDSDAPGAVLDLLDGGSAGVTELLPGAKNTTVYLNPADMGDTAGTKYEVVLHEFIHAATSPYLDFALEPELQGTRAAQLGRDLEDVLGAIRTHMERERGPYEGYFDVELNAGDGANTFADEHELLAWTLSNPEVMEYLDTVPYSGKQTIFQRFVEVVRNILGLTAKSDSALAEVLRIGGELLSTGDRQAGALLSGDPKFNPVMRLKKDKNTKTAEAKVNKGLRKAQLANDAAGFTQGLDEASAGAKLEAEEKRKAFMEAAVSDGFRPVTLAISPTSWIRDAITKIRPGLGSIVEGISKLEQQMRGMRTSMERAMRRRVIEVEKFSNKHGQAELSAMMTIARVNRVDVTAFATRAEALAKDTVLQHHIQNNNSKGAKKRTEDINTAWDAWDALGKKPGGHNVYKMMRQFYKDMYTALRAAQDEDIRSLGLDKAATDKLIKEARGDIDEDAVVEEGEHKGVPENLFPKEYFPFRRFGSYVLTVKTGKRAERERYHFESARERNEFEAKRAKQLGLKRGTDEYNAAFSRLDGLDNLRDNMTEESFLLTKLFSAIDETKTPDGATPEDSARFRKSVKDRLYQTYLMTLPERSLRKQFIHAELVSGQSADVLRVFRTSAGQYAGQLPKVMFGGKIQTQIEAAYDSIKEGDPAERAKLRAMVNTVVSRTRDALDPPQRSMLEQRINEFTFLSLMTSVASAAVQPMTLPFQVLPRMVARYGPLQALKMVSSYTPLLQAVNTVVDVDPATGTRALAAPTLGNVAYIKNNPLLARLWKELDQKRDLFSQKQVDMLLRDRATPGTSASTRGAKLLTGYEKLVVNSGALFSSMDQITREISGMSFAELEYNRLKKLGKSHEEAIEGAVEASVRNTNETIGDYTEVEKLDVFRGGPLRRMMGFLRTYAVQRTAYYFRMLDAIHQGSPAQTRRQAFSELSMVLGFTALGAGVGANFGYKFTTEVIDLILPLLLGEDEMEEWRRENPLGADSLDYRLRFQWIPSQFGGDESLVTRVAQRGVLSEMSGYDWTTRLSQSSMWLRDFQKGDNLRETTLNFLASNLAPQVSQGATMLDGINEFMEGNWSKGFTKISPAAVRGLFTASRYASEGETTRSGLPVRAADEFTANELVGQVLGFSPNELARVREANRKSQAWKRAMDAERGDLFKEVRDTLDDPETTREDVALMVEKLRRFNAKVPLDSSGKPISRYLIEPEDLAKSVRGRETRETKSVRGVEYAPGEYETLFGRPPQ